MVVQSNIPAINAHRNLGINNNALSKNLEKLSSGYKINRAGDDAAGLAISEKMRSQIRGLEMAEQNTENAVSLIQTAEGGLNETHAILQRMRELAVQSSNGTYTDEDRAQITLEYDALMEEVTRIAESTHYNGINLLNGNLEDGYAVGTEYTSESALSDIAVTSVAVTGAADGTGGGTGVDLTDATYEITIAGDGTATAVVTLKDGTELTTTASAKAAAGGTVTFTVNGTSGNPGTAADATIAVVIDAAWDAQASKIEGTISAGASKANDNAGNAATSAVDDIYSGDEVIGSELVFQIGANGTADQRVNLSVSDMSAEALGIDQSSVDTIANANDAIDILDEAINTVSSQRASLGALQNRLEHTLNSLGVSIENLTAAESTIRDTDMASEMMKFTQNSILVQASQAMLAQANALPQGILSLLG